MAQEVTVKVFASSLMFTEWIITKTPPNKYSLSYYVEDSNGILSNRLKPLNTSRWKLIRNIELKILNKLLNKH